MAWAKQQVKWKTTLTTGVMIWFQPEGTGRQSKSCHELAATIPEWVAIAFGGGIILASVLGGKSSRAFDGASGQQSGSANAKVAGGLMQALDEHPGGLAGILDQFRQNGMGDHVQNWASRQGQSATPAQVQQGLGGTGLIDNVAAKAGLSPVSDPPHAVPSRD